MSDNATGWLAMVGGSATVVAGIIFFASPNAVAEPMPPPVPSPVTVTQTVTVAPGAGSPLVAPQAATAPGVAAPQAVPGRAPVATAPSASLVPQAGVAPVAPTVAAPVTPTLVPATSGTITDYFKSKNVALEPQRAQGFQAFNITLADAAGLDTGARPERPRRVRGDRQPHQRRPVHAERSSGRLQARRRLRPEGGDHPRVRRQPVAVRLADHRRLADRLQRFPVVDHRGHLPAERHDAEHVAAARHRDGRSRQVPGVVVGDVDGQQPGSAQLPPTPPTRSSTGSGWHPPPRPCRRPRPRRCRRSRRPPQ